MRSGPVVNRSSNDDTDKSWSRRLEGPPGRQRKSFVGVFSQLFPFNPILFSYPVWFFICFGLFLCSVCENTKL